TSSCLRHLDLGARHSRSARVLNGATDLRCGYSLRRYDRAGNGADDRDSEKGSHLAPPLGLSTAPRFGRGDHFLCFKNSISPTSLLLSSQYCSITSQSERRCFTHSSGPRFPSGKQWLEAVPHVKGSVKILGSSIVSSWDMVVGPVRRYRSIKCA